MSTGPIHTQKRESYLKFISFLQALCCILVVFGHSFQQYPKEEGGILLDLYAATTTFRMPAFTFVSGFLMVYTMRLRNNPKSWRQFAASKLKRLVLPFLVLNLITYIPHFLKILLNGDFRASLLLEFPERLLTKNLIPMSYLWFLQMSFTLLVFCYAMLKGLTKMGIKDIWVYILCILLFASLPWLPLEYPGLLSINMVVQLGLFFALGMAYARFMHQADRFVPWSSPVFLAAVSVIWLIIWKFSINSLTYLLAQLTGLGMCISLSKILEARNINILSPLAGSTYLIFLLSWYFNLFSQQILSRWVTWPWYWHTILSLTTGILVPWLFYRYMLAHPDSMATKFSERFLGQSFNKNR